MARRNTLAPGIGSPRSLTIDPEIVPEVTSVEVSGVGVGCWAAVVRHVSASSSAIGRIRSFSFIGPLISESGFRLLRQIDCDLDFVDDSVLHYDLTFPG